MELTFTLQKFNGPMDLLLHLIDKNKVDIFDIPIAEITDQYLAYLEQMQAGIEDAAEEDREGTSFQDSMDSMSDFMVMAATLLDIKCRMLLPPEVDEEGEEIDPRAELVEKLLEYKIYKYMSYELKEREDGASQLMFHKQNIPPEVKKYREPVDLNELLKDVTLKKLNEVFKEVMKRQEDRRDPIRSTFGKIEKDEVDQKQVMTDVAKRIMKRKKCTFKSLLTMKQGKMYVVVTFLTILELMKMGRVSAEQDDIFGEIMITAKDRSEWIDGYDEEVMFDE